MKQKKPIALIVDDEPDLLSLLAISLHRMGIESTKAQSVREALTRLHGTTFDFCLTDLRLPDGSGLEIVEHIHDHHRDTPVAIITAFGDTQTAVNALKLGAFDYVAKPLELEQLQNIVGAALRTARHTGANDLIAGAPSRTLLGRSQAMENTRILIAKVAKNQAPIHIFGETGTGKELIARLIHEQGQRADQSFVPVNCGAIPRELMESEFFGHKKGAFTDAHQDTQGLFQTAGGGTLFLDEIGELPVELQAKLLRAIQEKRVRPVGSATEISVDVRIISATHRDLRQMIADGTFREDFYYRINVIPIVAPPLRERAEDIAELTIAIAERLSANPALQVSEAAIAKLERYRFPGNVRELENIIERALALREGDAINADDIIMPETIGHAPPQTEAQQSELPIDEHIAHIEKERIKHALAETGGNMTAAAGLLGTTFRSLRYRIKRLGIGGDKN